MKSLTNFPGEAVEVFKNKSDNHQQRYELDCPTLKNGDRSCEVLPITILHFSRIWLYSMLHLEDFQTD